jgi:hypothetical protein
VTKEPGDNFNLKLKNLSSHMSEDSDNKYMLSNDEIQKLFDRYYFDKSVAPERIFSNAIVKEEKLENKRATKSALGSHEEKAK